MLNKHNNNKIPERTLKYIIKKQGITHKTTVNDALLKEIIALELQMFSSLSGYRQMTETHSVKYGTNISKKSLRKTLLEVDPEGVMFRRKKVLRRKMHYTD